MAILLRRCRLVGPPLGTTLRATGADVDGSARGPGGAGPSRSSASGVADPGSRRHSVRWLPGRTSSGEGHPTAPRGRRRGRSSVLDHRCAPAEPRSTTAGSRFMSEALWATRPRLATPEPAVWRGEPTTLAELRA